MPVDLIVRAEVIDIRGDVPLPEDDFLVDTNVWFWMAYPWASQTALNYQIREYPAYLDQARKVRGTLYRCDLSFAELAHVIEGAEREVYNLAHKPESTTKEYRHNFPAERANVVAEIQSAWGIVKSFSQPIALDINATFTDASVARLASSTVDGYDLFILEAMHRQGITQVITDDGDFSTVSGIRVFTANDNVIRLAVAAGKLITRQADQP